MLSIPLGEPSSASFASECTLTIASSCEAIRACSFVEILTARILSLQERYWPLPKGSSELLVFVDPMRAGNSR